MSISSPASPRGQQGENLSGASTFSPRAASDYNALGSQANTNAWLVDGIWDNEYTFNTVLVQPSVESVQEFKVLTGTYSAEFGGGAGVVSVSTRSGSNALHGEAFEFLRNRVLDAKPYQFTPAPVVKPPFKRNQFGAAVGGRSGATRRSFSAIITERAIKAVERIRSRERKLIDSVRGAGFKVSDLREGLLE